MPENLLKHKLAASLFFGALVLVHVLWEFFRGGVSSHHFLAREDLPAISNWWGLLSIPLLTWAVFKRIEGRVKRADAGSGKTAEKVATGFFGGLLFGLSLAVLWEFGRADSMPYMLLLPMVLALFFPVYRAECLLGFVVGMAYTFGGVLPIVIGGVLVLFALLIHKGIRGGFLWLVRQFQGKQAR